MPRGRKGEKRPAAIGNAVAKIATGEVEVLYVHRSNGGSCDEARQ
jgi:hypothetical protein